MCIILFPQRYVKAFVPSWCVSTTVAYCIGFLSCCLLECMWLLMCLTAYEIHSSWCSSCTPNSSVFRRPWFILVYITQHIVHSLTLLWGTGLFYFLRMKSFCVFLFVWSYHIFPKSPLLVFIMCNG